MLTFLSLTEAELLGLRHRNETANGALNEVSFAGGLEFFIDGAGMDDEPHINAVMFRPTQGEDIIDLTGPPLESKFQITPQLTHDVSIKINMDAF